MGVPLMKVGLFGLNSGAVHEPDDTHQIGALIE